MNETELKHCRICHRDTNDMDKHWNLHHQGSGGFSTKCEEWNCPRAKSEKNFGKQNAG